MKPTNDNEMTSQDEVQAKQAVAYGMFIKGSLKWRAAYFLMKILMAMESIVWTMMDFLRSWRMRVASRINSNYQRYNDPTDRV